MKANKFYSGISAIYSGTVVILIFMTDVSYFSDKSKLSIIISVFGALEFLKYFILRSQFSDFLKVQGTTVASYSNSIHKTSFHKRLKRFLKRIVLLTVLTALYHIAIVLLGAGFVENFEETFLLSALLSVLTYLPLCLYFGSQSCVRAVFDFYPGHISSFEVTLRQTRRITLFGAWLGAFVIPLDWDRPWQKWPVPCAVGAVSGYCISHIMKVPSSQVPKVSV